MAKDREAKIKFTAEVGAFNDAIKKSNNEMSKLRAELKLNETQMKATGVSVEGLQKKHQLLTKQHEEAEAKTAALTAKIEAAVRHFGANSEEVTRLQRQLATAKTEEERLAQAIEKCNAELDEQKSAAAKAKTATAQLVGEIDDQQRKVDDLKEAYVEAVLSYGKNSKEARSLKKEIKNLSAELGDNQKALGKAEAAADKLDKSYDNAGDAARDSAEGFTVAKGAIADLASNAVQMAVGKVSEFVDYLKELPEATRELRQDMATLETSFSSAGLSTEQAKKTWQELYAVFGEDDRAVEAANLIAKMAKDQEDLNTWVTITTGVYGQYQDSLPVEGLAEAANETAKCGTVTGVLADALNWSSEASKMFSKYMSEDVVTAEDAFNEALAKCTTEEERQTLITDTLTKLYGDAANKYRDAAGAQMDAKNAAAENTLAQNNLAAAVEPVTTAWQGMKTQLITAVTPAIEAVSGKLTKCFNWLQKHPAALKAVSAAFAVLAAGLGVLTLVWVGYTVAQMAANAAMLPIIGIAAAVVVGIAAVVAIGVALWQNWDKIKAKCSETWNNVKAKFADAKQAVVGRMNEMKTGVVEKFNAIKSGATEKIESMKSAVSSKFEAIKNGIMKPIETAREKVRSAIDKIKSYFKFSWSLPKLKMPHITISGKFSINPPSVPKFGIKWYKAAMNNPMILNSPTIFGYSKGRFLGGGEAGSEVVAGTNTLMGMIQSAVDRATGAYDIHALAAAVEDLANRPVQLNVNGRQFATATASDGDSVNGLRTSFKSRGLIVD